jgi:hypothetical protein
MDCCWKSCRATKRNPQGNSPPPVRSSKPVSLQLSRSAYFICQGRENAQAAAVRTLRDLDTEAAVTYLASIYGRNRRTESGIEYALFSSAHRALIIRELERRMTDPDLMLTQDFLMTRTQLKAFLQENNTGRPISQEDWNLLNEAVNKRAFDLAPGKTPEARAGTYFYLFGPARSRFAESGGTSQTGRILPFAAAFHIEVLLFEQLGRDQNRRSSADPDSETSGFASMAATESECPWFGAFPSGRTRPCLRSRDPRGTRCIDCLPSKSR